MAAEINTDRCTGCALCVDVCPAEAITLDNGKAEVNDNTCVDCGLCMNECPNDAITVD